MPFCYAVLARQRADTAITMLRHATATMRQRISMLIFAAMLLTPCCYYAAAYYAMLVSYDAIFADAATPPRCCRYCYAMPTRATRYFAAAMPPC